MSLDSDLTLAATLATELGVSSGDAKLPRIISAASDACLRYLNRRRLHYGAAISELVATFGRRRILLDVTPLLSITSVTLVDGTVLDASQYAIDEDEAGLLLRLSRWSDSALVRPGMTYQDRDGGSERKGTTIVYAGGWVTPVQASAGGSPPARTLPYDIEQAALVVAAAMYRSSGADPRVQSESLGDYSVNYWPTTAPLPEQAARLLDPHRRLV